MERLFPITLSVVLILAFMMIYQSYVFGSGKLLSNETNDSQGEQAIESGQPNGQLFENSTIDSNETAHTNNTHSEPAFIFDNQSGSGLVTLKSRSFWKDSLLSCKSIFKCTPSSEGWKNSASLELSTKVNDNNTWS